MQWRHLPNVDVGDRQTDKQMENAIAIPVREPCEAGLTDGV